MQSFKELQLDPLIQKGVDSAGYQRPFPIQELAIAPLLLGRNVIGQAKTGSGKTAAFGIPLLQSIDSRVNRVQALVLAPTRELAVQITSELKKIGAYTGARIVTIYGGQSINVQFETLRRGVHVVVGTTGRVIDHIQRGTLLLDSAKFDIIYEADTMLDMGFVDDVECILDSVSENRQLSLFTATMPQPIVELARKYMRDPERILVDANDPTVETLEQFYAVVNQEEKYSLLTDLLGRLKPNSTVIFCRTKYGTRRLARELERQFQSVVPLHGDLSQHQRDHSMSTFRQGNAGDSGKAYTFVSPEEFEDFARIKQMSKWEIKPLRPEDASHHLESVQPNNQDRGGYGGGFQSRGRSRYGSRRRWTQRGASRGRNYSS